MRSLMDKIPAMLLSELPGITLDYPLAPKGLGSEGMRQDFGFRKGLNSNLFLSRAGRRHRIQMA